MTAKLVVLASGSGRTIENLQHHILHGSLDAKLIRIIVSNESCGAIERCERLGLDVSVVSKGAFLSNAERDQATLELIRGKSPDWVLMAGWLRLLPIPSDLEGKVLNIHPALLPGFGGKGAYGSFVHEAVHAQGRTLSGCTVHFASSEYDRGPALIQEAVFLHPNMSATEIAAVVFNAEKRAYPAALQALISGRAMWRNGKVYWA